MCVYIYIYIYIYECVWVSVYVHGWVAKGGILSWASLTSVRVSRGFSFVYIFGRKNHTKICVRMNLRDQKQGQRTLVSKRDRHSGLRMWGQWVKAKMLSLAVKKKRHEAVKSEMRRWAVKIMTRWVSIFGSCLGFSQGSCDSHTNTQWVPKILYFILNQCFVLSSLNPPFVIVNFCSSCEMPTHPAVRRNNGIHTTRQTANQTNPLCGLFHSIC